MLDVICGKPVLAWLHPTPQTTAVHGKDAFRCTPAHLAEFAASCRQTTKTLRIQKAEAIGVRAITRLSQAA